ncbi:VOC family protein [Nakamurella endophytica]|uniref:VOC family protein n=1 Tax=Nakamurella endophytica TaxID=1748367 RepID=UPI00166BDFBA|nr:VOC family protein [Nakamurella endophytica]
MELELALPVDVAPARVAAAVAAGGRPLDGSTERWRAADPEGNGVVVVARP